ncbi:MAG: hypothetical protein GY755_02205 [Chloroflexi bacterium]|nr:hypothetical protein [Chloroflexota bacterium]
MTFPSSLVLAFASMLRVVTLACTLATLVLRLRWFGWSAEEASCSSTSGELFGCCCLAGCGWTLPRPCARPCPCPCP